MREEWRILDYKEGNESKGGMKNGGMRQTSLPYVHVYDYTNGMNLHCVQPQKRNDVPHLCTMNQNAICKNKKKFFLKKKELNPIAPCLTSGVLGDMV